MKKREIEVEGDGKSELEVIGDQIVEDFLQVRAELEAGNSEKSSKLCGVFLYGVSLQNLQQISGHVCSAFYHQGADYYVNYLPLIDSEESMADMGYYLVDVRDFLNN
ncbi:MAG: hypothetical protein U9Q06_04040 [Nanoarchaeota archaeon]|nr:hypothetical protein [Nanoarchaeota archaeon]